MCGVLSIIFAIISRRTLGYFDGLSIAAIIVSIFGIAFSALIIYTSLVLVNDPEFMPYYNELMKQLETEGGTEVFSFVKKF